MSSSGDYLSTNSGPTAGPCRWSVFSRSLFGGILPMALWLVGGLSLATAQVTPIAPAVGTEWRFNQQQDVSDQSWTAVNYDDSGGLWQAGPSGFSYETSANDVAHSGGALIRTTLQNPGAGGSTVNGVTRHAIYFRKKFRWAGPTAGTFLNLRTRWDDSGLIYLNGQVVFNNTGLTPPLAFGAFTRGAIGAGTEGIVDENASVDISLILQPGDNVLAAELHQVNATSSDQVFVCDASIVIPFAPIITDSTQPDDRTIEQNRSTTLIVRADGLPAPAYQWFHDNDPILDATNSSYTIAAMAASDAGKYFARVTNSIGMTNSRTATVGYLQDTTPPMVLRAIGSATFDKIVIEFSEPMETNSVTDPFQYVVSPLSLMSVTLNSNRTSVTIMLSPSGLQAQDTLYTVTMSDVLDLASNSVPANSAVTFRSWTTRGCNGLLFETFNTPVAGTAVSLLTSSPNYPDNPRESLRLTRFDSREVYPDDSHEQFGGRIRGLFIPPMSGNWIFFLRSDDASELYFNPNGPSTAGRTLIARELGCCNNYLAPGAAQTSVPQALIGGRAYYIDALYKEGGGNDFLQVAGRLEGEGIPPITEFLSGGAVGYPAIPSDIAAGLTITQQPADRSVQALQPVTFTVAAANPNGLLICYQWQRSDNGGAFADVAGATKASYTVALPTVANDDGDVYRVIVSGPGVSLTSDNAKLTVTPDIVPPTLVYAIGLSPTSVAVYYSEPMPSTASDPFAYTIDGGVSVQAGANNATNPKRVDLTTSPMTIGNRYTLTTTTGSIKDMSGNAIDPDPSSTRFVAQDFTGATPAVDPDNLKPISAALGRPLGSLSDRGFDVRLVQVSAVIANDNGLAEQMLAGMYPTPAAPLPNIAPLPCFVETNIINYNKDIPGASSGRITNDIQFPGYAPNPTAATAGYENMAMEVLAYVELTAGVHRLNVPSDDGFRVTPATGATDANNAIVLGEFNGGRGVADSFFDVFVAEDGLYPIRLIWEQGQGGASLEFESFEFPAVSFIAINAVGGLRAFRAPSTTPTISIVMNGTNVVISWPATAVGYCLQCTPSLTPLPATWTIVTNPVVLSGGRWSVTIPKTGTRFYRLIRR